jgi:flagellar basal-body rod modification protein FlgD
MTTTTNVASPPVSGTTPLPSSTSSNGSLSSTTGSTLAGNFQTFLQMLTTQLQNQNPLDPLDTNQFTQQLVEFASVEQQLKTNDQLASLIALQQTTQATQALNFVGKNAVVDGSTAALSNSKATWVLDVPNTGTMNVSITNSSGQTVFSGSSSVTAGKDQAFNWNGQASDGSMLPDGKYTLHATMPDSSGNAVGISTQIQGVVTSVDLTQSPPLLSIGDQTYTIDQIKRIVS